MICTTQKNNLYDSVINEAEKITEYQKKFSKIGEEDMTLLQKYEYDVDLMMFIHFHCYEIITDKMFRSFVNINQAIDRCYNSILSELKLPERTYAVYSPIPFYELYRIIDDITNRRSRRKLYDPSVEKDIFELSFLEYCELKDRQSEDYIKNLDIERIVVSKELLREATNRCYKKLKDFMALMRCELEAKPYYEQTSIVMKHIFHVILVASNTAITVSIE